MTASADLARDGFAVVRDVLTPEQARGLRTTLEGMFARPATFEGDFDRRGRIGSVRFDICAREPSLRWLLTHPPLIAALTDALGEDFVFLPEMSAHHGGYGDWHKDTTSQERAGLRFQWEPEYLMVEAAFYCQDNTEAFGGGLEVIRASHRTPDRYLDVIDRNVFDKVRTKLKAMKILPTQRGELLPTRPGDLLLFDFRLDHRASPASKPVPKEHEKYAIFFACARNTKQVRQYVDYIKSRPDYQFLKTTPDESFARELGAAVSRLAR
jgi:ectoine hydroxylase-related dioxygenase (phytanoyl-CoA dioxygenase family)